MARASFAAALELVLALEGGYVDHPLDPGGATKFGITRKVLAEWRGRPVSKAEVMALTAREAGAIYRARYWDAVCCDDLPAGLDLTLFDLAVNSGPSRAGQLLARALGLDGGAVLSDAVFAAAEVRDPIVTIKSLSAQRLAFLERLRTWKTFGRGWSRRVAKVEATALQLTEQGRLAKTLSHPAA